MVQITGAFCCSGDVIDLFTVFLRFLALGTAIFVGSLLVSGSQARAMQRVLGESEGKWLWQSAVGMFVGWILGWLASIPVFTTVKTNTVETWMLAGAIIGAVIGFLTGFFQLLILHRLRIARLWWIGVTVVGWICASALYWLVYALAGGPFQATYTYYEGGFWPKSANAPGALPAMLLAWLSGGLVLSLITGGGMLRLLRSIKVNNL